jgi:DNA-binding CsgD family transcriptional regulator
VTGPYQVLAPGADSDAEIAAAAQRLRRQGWRVRPGFAVPDHPWDLAPGKVALVGELTSEPEAQAALLAATRGAALVLRLDPTAPWAVAFLADLARLADRHPGEPATRPAAGPGGGDLPVPALSAEQRQLLDLLADGISIAQAARRMYLSLRTANRRVAEARVALGAATTREAVLTYLRLRGGG